MTPLRTRDKLFLAVVIPAAAIAAYFWLLRMDAAKRADALELWCAALVSNGDFPARKAAAEAAKAAAEAELEREKAVPPPERRLKCDLPSAPFAEREGAVLGAFRDAGVAVLKAADAEGGAAGGVLAAAVPGLAPRCRRYVLDGTYPAVRRALDLFVSRETAAVPETLEMKQGGSRWEISVWE